MNKWIFGGLGMLVGGAVTGVVTYILTKRKYQKWAERQIFEMSIYYKEKANTDEDPGGVQEALKAIDHPEASANVQADYFSAPNVAESKLDRDMTKRSSDLEVDYTRFYNGTTGECEPITEEPDKNTDPYVIPPGDFGAVPGYSTQALIYYVNQNILTVDDDTNEEVLSDFDEVESMLGGMLDESGFSTNDSWDTIYIRNPRRLVDYEIAKSWGDYPYGG